jgi:hypothetical protein
MAKTVLNDSFIKKPPKIHDFYRISEQFFKKTGHFSLY